MRTLLYRAPLILASVVYALAIFFAGWHARGLHDQAKIVTPIRGKKVPVWLRTETIIVAVIGAAATVIGNLIAGLFTLLRG